jgi:hypothetical protein
MAERARKGGWDLMARNYDEQAEHAEVRAGLVRSVLVAKKPEQITEQSAQSIQAKAAKAMDRDAGKARRKEPPEKVPPGAPKPPDPAYGNTLERALAPSDRAAQPANSRLRGKGARGRV